MLVTDAPQRVDDNLTERTRIRALREQALIEEARRRTRRRRRGYAGAAIVVLSAAVGIVLAHIRSPETGAAVHASGPVSSVQAIHESIAIADGSGSLLVVNPDGSGLRTAARCSRADTRCGIYEPAWSPDGTRLAFLRGKGLMPPNLSEKLSLFVLDTRDGKVRRLAVCGDCGVINRGVLAWSPDGARIAFTRDSARVGHQSIWVVDRAGGGPRRLTSCPVARCIDVQPAWAANGRLIVFTRIGGYRSALYTVRPDGTHLARIKTVPGAIDPSWSPDGRTIAFDAADSIYVTILAGSRSTRLVAGSGAGSGPGAPSWSPDGARLAFFSTPGQSGAFTAEVWTMNADGSAKRRVAHTACCVESWAAPVWSPDGRKIAYAATSAGCTFVVNATCGGSQLLTARSASTLSWRVQRRR